MIIAYDHKSLDFSYKMIDKLHIHLYEIVFYIFVHLLDV